MHWMDFFAGVGAMLFTQIICLVAFVVIIARPELSPSVLPDLDPMWLAKIRPTAEKVLDETEARIVAEIPKVISLAERGALKVYRDEFGQTIADREAPAPAPIPGPRWPATAEQPPAPGA